LCLRGTIRATDARHEAQPMRLTTRDVGRSTRDVHQGKKIIGFPAREEP
jgi:hypothetical protein